MADNVRAEVRGETLLVKLQVWHLGIIIGIGASVIFSVWLTTRDLGKTVDGLSTNVNELRLSISDHSHATRSLETRVMKLETRLDVDGG